MSTVSAVAAPLHASVNPGEPATFVLSITNTSSVIDAYRTEVFGVDAEWVTTTPERLPLFPGKTATMTVEIALPGEYPSTERSLAFHVTSENEPAEFALAQSRLDLAPQPQLDVRADPAVVTGGKRAVYALVVENRGNVPVEAVPFGVDPEAEIDEQIFTFDPPSVLVPVGRMETIRVTAQGGRPWFGQIKPRTFTLGVAATDPNRSTEPTEPIEVPVTFLQRPRISRWLFVLLGFVAAVAVFAFVLRQTFGDVVDEATVVDGAVVEKALSDDAGGGGPGIPVNPGVLSGQVVSPVTGLGLGGLQVRLYQADDTVVPRAEAVTDADGSFSVGGLKEDEYKLQLSGAGFDPFWYPGSETAADAEPIPVTAGDSAELDDPLAIGGRPGSVAGRVTTADPVGAVARLVVPSRDVEGARALVAEVPVSADGSFLFEGVPAPADYELRVSKRGYATESRPLRLDAADALDGLEIALRPGDGVIRGSVADRTRPDDGALGGAVITATDGVDTWTTVALTEGTVGSFTLRNLPIPGRYSVTATAEGYASETISVLFEEPPALSDEPPPVPPVAFSLLPARGRIAGRAQLREPGNPNGVAAGGVTVSVSGPGYESVTTSISSVTTSISSVTSIGDFEIDRVPVPGVYTLTFTREGYLPQVQLVDLDANNVERLDVTSTLLRETGIVKGLVVQRKRGETVPVSYAEVTISDGTDEGRYVVLTPDEQDTEGFHGRFEVSGIPPGSYTVTAEVPGAEDAVRIVTVLPATEADIRLDIGTQARVFGTVRLGDGTAVTNATVRLVPLDDFPLSIVGDDDVEGIDYDCTDASGSYDFVGFDADQRYVVAVYETRNTSDRPLASVDVEAIAGVEIDVDREFGALEVPDVGFSCR